ncbi:MAG: hypothetical protein R3286_05090 [Gammaproteobacteria bacterium]|nr:hypothetical protein [Gammaproteobacteria bacterium]
MRQTGQNSGRPRAKAILLLILLPVYPIVVHLSIVYDVPVLLIGLLLVLFTVLVVLAVRKGGNFLSAVSCLVALIAIVVLWRGRPVDLVYLPPVLVNVVLMFLFGRTLLPGRTPLVTRMATLLRGELDETYAGYTRRVTQAWTIFFVFLAVECVVLAKIAPLEVWSLVTNFVNYVLVFLFFAVEYRIRLVCLRGYPHLGFIEFFRVVAKADLRSLAG